MLTWFNFEEVDVAPPCPPGLLPLPQPRSVASVSGTPAPTPDCGPLNQNRANDVPKNSARPPSRNSGITSAAARVTRRSVAELELLGETFAPMAYDIRSFAKLGLLSELISGVDADPGPGAVGRPQIHHGH